MNVVDTIRDFARAHPDHLAVVATTPEGKCEISYAALIGRIDRIARALSVHGVGRAERVGVMAPQTPQFIETALAVISTGACLVPIPADTRGATLDEFCGTKPGPSYLYIWTSCIGSAKSGNSWLYGHLEHNSQPSSRCVRC